MKKKLSILFAVFAIIFCLAASATFFPDIIVTSPDGIWTDTRAYTNLSTALTAIGANERDVYIVREETVTTLVIPANIRLHFLKSGAIANSNTLTINTRNIHADHQIFTGAGAVNFASGSEVRTRWFEDFETAITQTSNDTVTLTVDTADTLSNSAAVGDNVLLKWNSLNLITIAGGQTLSNIGDISAPDIRLFVVSGSIAFKTSSPLVAVRACWLGSTLATLDIADNAAYAAGKPLVITPGAWVIDSDVTLASNLKVLQGVDLQVATLTTLTINGTLDIGLHRIFSCIGIGKVVLPVTAIAYPQWWGTNVTASVNAALASGAGVVDLGSDTYVAATTVLWDISKCAMRGNGAKFDAKANPGIGISVYNDSIALSHYTFLKRRSGGFEIEGDRTTNAASVGMELGSNVSTNTAGFHLENVVIHNFNINLHFNPDEWAEDWFACTFDKLSLYDANYGVKAVYGGERNYFNECSIHDNVHGFYVNQGNWTLSNCNIDHNHSRSIHAENAARVDMKGGHLESQFDDDYWLYCTGGSTMIRLSQTSITNSAGPKTYEIGLADQCGALGIVLDGVSLEGGFTAATYGLDNLVKVTDYTGNVSFKGMQPFISSDGLPTTETSRLMLSSHLNYLLDGGYEEASIAPDWTASSGAGYDAPVLDAVEFHGSAQSLQFAPAAGNQTQIIRSIPCRVGEWGRMTFWIKNDLSTSTDTFRIEAGYLAADGSEVPYYSNTVDLTGVGTHYDTWTQLWLTPYYPAPAGAAAVYFKFKVGTGASDGNGETWIDDAQINMWIQ